MSPERFEKIKDVLNKRQPDVTVILDNVHKPHNIAAILRSCDATGIGNIHSRAKSSKIGLNLKAASGSNHWVKVYFHNQLSELYKSLSEKNYNIFVANNSDGVILYEIQRQREKAGLYKSRRLGINEYENLLFEFSYPKVATILQKKGRPYPKLDKFGQIIS